MVTLSLNVASPVTPSVPPTVVFLRSASSVTVSLPSTFVPFSVVSPVTESVLSMVTSPLRVEAFSTFREPAFTVPASTTSPFSLPFAVTLPRSSTVTLFSIVVSFLTSSRLIPAVRLSVATIASLLILMLSALALILPSSSVSFALRSLISVVTFPSSVVIFPSSSLSFFSRAVFSSFTSFSVATAVLAKFLPLILPVSTFVSPVIVLLLLPMILPSLIVTPEMLVPSPSA